MTHQILNKLYLTLLFLISLYVANAQNSKLESANNAFEKKQYERVLKLFEDMKEHPETSKNPHIYVLASQTMFELNKNEYYRTKKEPDCIKIACKHLEKAYLKDKEKTIWNDYSEYIIDLGKECNKMALEEYNINKFSKAIKFYDYSYRLCKDTFAYFMIGKSYIQALDTVNGINIYKNIINIYENNYNNKGKLIPEADPFIFFSEYYWKSKNYDSALYYVNLGNKIFENKNSKLTYYNTLISKEQLNNLPPTSFLSEKIATALEKTPKDTFLLKKQNKTALYIIRNAIEVGDQAITDSSLFRFSRAKAKLANLQGMEDVKSHDLFLEKLSENVIWKISDYYYNNSYFKAAAYTAKTYINITSSNYPKSSEKDIISRWIKIIEYSTTNKPEGYTAMLIEEAIKNYPKSKELLALKKK